MNTSKKTPIKIDKQVFELTLKDIKSFKFKDCYLDYSRQSTDEAESQKNSIPYQNEVINEFADKHDLQIADISVTSFCKRGHINERHSAFKESDIITFSQDGKVQYRIDRPKFQQLLVWLNKGYFKGIICLCWDRISRNESDDTIIRKLMNQGVDIRFVTTAYDDSSSGTLHMEIDSIFARHHSRVTSEKVSGHISKSKAKGFVTSRAPIGYLNTGSMELKPVDPKRAPYIIEMYELYATGNWSFRELMEHANKSGLRTPPARKRRTKLEMLDDDIDINDIPKVSRPISINLICRILRSPFYTGRVRDEHGIWIKSNSHEALIDDQLFQKVQLELKRKKVSVQYTEKLPLPLRGCIRCAKCTRVYTPYVKKGITYYNARCRKGCTNSHKNFNLNFIVNKILDSLRKITLSEDEVEMIEAKSSTELALLEVKRSKENEVITRKKKKLNEDLAYLRTHKIQLLRGGLYNPESYLAEENNLNGQLLNLHLQEMISAEAIHETVKEVFKLSELLKSIVMLYEKSKMAEKVNILKNLISELSVCDESVKIKVISGLEPLETRLFADCGQSNWLSELLQKRPHIKESIRLCQLLLKMNS